MPSVAVIVPATDRPPTLGACREAIEEQVGPLDDLIVVTDTLGLGPAAARNRGAREARGDLLLFVDADIVIHPDTIARFRAAFDADPQLVALFGAYDDRPAARHAVGAFRNLLHHYVHKSSAGQVETFWAGLGAIRRDAFDAAGGFEVARCTSPHARIGHGRGLGRAGRIEDVELGMRLADAGAAIRLDPTIRGTHLKSWTLREMVSMDLLDRGIPWVRLLCRRRQLPSPTLSLSWRHRLSALAILLGVVSVPARRAVPGTVAFLALLSLNRSFYRLMLLRSGPAHALAGIGLHVVHLVTAVAAVPLGILAHLRGELGDDLVEVPVRVDAASLQAASSGDPRDPFLEDGAEAPVEHLVDLIE